MSPPNSVVFSVVLLGTKYHTPFTPPKKGKIYLSQKFYTLNFGQHQLPSVYTIAKFPILAGVCTGFDPDPLAQAY
ncbi:hypothetical protein J43TS9_32450 [Paenibacillus cineris]|nr:hypothetical protein J43TS9_32450 [Paenibacillus cineris]